jgi:lysophospholipase L1-like esterase
MDRLDALDLDGRGDLNQVKTKMTTDVAVQTTDSTTLTTPLKTYAEAVGKFVHPQEPTCEKEKSTEDLKAQKELHQKKKFRNISPEESNDVRTKNASTSGDVPKVLLLGDSTTKHLDADRLGKSYGFYCKSRKTYKIKDISSVLEKSKQELSSAPDCIVLHVGINDVKVDPVNAAKQLAVAVKKAKAIYDGKTKVVVSHPTPVREINLERKREVFVAQSKQQLQGEDITFVSHNMAFVRRRGLLEHDNIHPTVSGTSFMAGSLGRHLRGLLWERQKRRPQRPRPRVFSHFRQYEMRYNYNPWMYPNRLVEDY